MSWLEKYAWPAEEKFHCSDYTLVKVNEFTEKLLSVGTLGGACYASIHPHSVEYALDSFIGNYVIGNVLMTMNSPDYLLQEERNIPAFLNTINSDYIQ